jgi:LacI family transcriptional regulator
VPDEVQGGYTAVAALTARGHRRIGFINNVDPIPAASGRLEGYRQALTAAGLPFDPALVRAGKSNGEGGRRCAAELLALPERPTALFCFNDLIAMGAYDAIKAQGLRIPEDIAVVGFDNLEVIAEHLYPPLSTVRLPHYKMGEWGVKFVLGLIDTPPGPILHLAPCEFVERGSA